MGATFVISRREFRSYFLSPIAYVVGSIFLVVGASSFFRWIFVEAGGAAEARMDIYFAWLPQAMLFLASLVAMSLWADERKLGTLELLLTYPVRSAELIAGKFFGALGFIAVLLLLTLPYAISMSTLGDLDWGPVLGGYLGALLLGAAYLSFGLFASSLTRDQIIAAIVSIVFLFLINAFSDPINGIDLGAGWVSFFQVVSPSVHFQSITRGVVDVGDLVFYFVFCGFFLFLNALVLEIKKRVG